MENKTNETQNEFSKENFHYLLELNITLENPCELREIKYISQELNKEIDNKFEELKTEIFLRNPTIYGSFMAIGYYLNSVHLGQLPEPYNEIPFIKQNLRTVFSISNVLTAVELLKYPNQFMINTEDLNEILTDLRKRFNIKLKEQLEIEKQERTEPEYDEELFNKVFSDV